MARRWQLPVTMLGLGLLLGACSKEEPVAPPPAAEPAPVAAPPAPPAEPAPAAAQPAPADPAAANAAGQDAGLTEARTFFATRCVTCHGASGKGDGPGGAALNPKPRDYTNAEWQAATTDDVLRKTILEGGAAVGKSPAMPPAPDLKDKPAVVDGLIKIIREFGQKPQ